MTGVIDVKRLALVASSTERAQEAAAELSTALDFVSMDEAETVIVLGGDGFMLHTLHTMLDKDRVVPAYGLNCGTVGFLMNKYRGPAKLIDRLAKARRFDIAPLR
ncbi:MAG: NAD(+)/NADH kinase, partial [Tsuneonella sp.]